MKKSMKGIDEIRDAISQFRRDRQKVTDETNRLTALQPELLGIMKKFDPDNHGIIVDPDDQNKGTAYYQQNAAGEFWDVEGIMDWIMNSKTGKAHRMAVTSRMFDPMKWEAEVANGNISAKTASKFRKLKSPPAPFIRFGKSKNESL